MSKKIENLKIPSARNDDQPATRRVLNFVRDELKSEIKTLERKMDIRFDEMKTETIRMNILLEEQHSNNRIVLEGLQALWQRQDRIEKKVDSKF